MTTLAETIKGTAFKITRVGQLVATEASKMLGVSFGIVDLSLAPTPTIGDSVAHILKKWGLEKTGAHGTTAALAMLNDAVKKAASWQARMSAGFRVLLSLFRRDAGMMDAVACGALTIEKLEAMTAVCSVGLDMIAIPGDTPEDAICGIIADEISIGVVNNKTTAVRIIPVYGKNPVMKSTSADFSGPRPRDGSKQHVAGAVYSQGGRIRGADT